MNWDKIYHTAKLEFEDGNLYMTRYCLFDTFMIHVTRKVGFAFHNHPWSFCSLLLWGSYYEEVKKTIDGPVIAHQRKWGSVIYRKQTDWHRITTTHPISITFCIKGPFVEQAVCEDPDGEIISWMSFVNKYVHIPKRLIVRAFKDYKWRY